MYDRPSPSGKVAEEVFGDRVCARCCAGGRSIDFGEDMKDMITDIDLERTKKQKFCSAPFIRNIMKQLSLKEFRVPRPQPCSNWRWSSVSRGWRFIQTLSSTMMKERFPYSNSKWMLSERPLMKSTRNGLRRSLGSFLLSSHDAWRGGHWCPLTQGGKHRDKIETAVKSYSQIWRTCAQRQLGK